MVEQSPYYPSDVSTEIELDANRTLIDLFNDAVNDFADHDALECFNETISYNRLNYLSGKFAGFLQHLGIEPGDRVALMSPNCIPFVVSMWGIIRAGAIQVSINPFYTAQELKSQLVDADVETLVLFDGATGSLADIIEQTSINHVITFSITDLIDVELPSPEIDPRLTNTLSFNEIMQRGTEYAYSEVMVDGDAPAFLQYTGGTTGISKGATLTHGNLVGNVTQFLVYCGERFKPGTESIMTAIPMYHIFALMVNGICLFTLGGKNILMPNPRDLDDFVALWQAKKPTIFSGVNTLYKNLLDHPEFSKVDFSQLKFSVGGGAPIQRKVSEQWLETTGCLISEGYGLSETSPVVTLNLGKDNEFVPGIGLPLPGTEISLRNAKLVQVEAGERGELCIRGPQVMSGYWRNVEATSEAMTEDGYFRSGDIAVQDADGFFHIVDRLKDMVLVSGFNVYPNEIEAIVSGMNEILDCACIGVDDPDTGEAVKLFVVPAPSTELTELDIIDYCRPRLAAYKVPKHIEFKSELPKSSVGKTLRRELR